MAGWRDVHKAAICQDNVHGYNSIKRETYWDRWLVTLS